ncbi:MAG: hypothetical protein HQL87_05810 [Magnetococcales bacterium]|nr:hypothetical protein [Magnetococcales bacterium]
MKRLIVVLLLGLLLALPYRADAISVGDSAQVSWKGKWYPSKILEISGSRMLIHYDGFESSWDEWVSMDRVKIEVLWKDKWYKARTLQSSEEDGKVLIHYEGYENSWDERVPLDRIRAAR